MQVADRPWRPAGRGTSGEVAGLDPEIPVYDLQTVEQVVFGSIVQDRSSTFLLTIFAVIALFLAAIGVYGVMAHSVSRRTHEIGIRMTLGARRREILALVIRQGMRLAIIAAGLGVALSLAVTRVLEGALFEVTSLDPITYILVPIVLLAVAAAACYVPAFRASRLDPTSALRVE